MKQKKNGLNLFLTMFQVGCIGFGGGNALIPVLHKKTVEEQRMISDEEYEEDVMIASITPGALPVEIAGGIGRRLQGWKGLLLGSYGMALPGVLATIILLSVFEVLNDCFTLQIKFITIGVSAFICVLLLDYVIGTFERKRDIKKKKYDGLIMFLVFLLTCGKSLYKILGISITPVFGLATIDVFALAFFLIFCNAKPTNLLIRFFSITMSVIYILFRGKGIPIYSQIGFETLSILMLILSIFSVFSVVRKERLKLSLCGKNKITAIGALLVLVLLILVPSILVSSRALEFAGKGVLSSLISFGGGDAYLTVADGMFVETGMIVESDFYGSLVPIVNVLPGSILCKTLSGIGFYMGIQSTDTILGGILIATLGFVVSVFASCGIFLLIHACFGVVSHISVFAAIKIWIRPIVSGLMFTVILSLMNQSRKISSSPVGWFYVILMMVLFFIGMILHKRKWSNLKIIGTVVFFSLVCCNVLNVLIGV